MKTIIGIILLYLKWIIRHYHLLIRGKNLEPFTLINRNKCSPPKLVKFGLTDIPQYPGGNWHWKHKHWSFYASRGNRPYMEDRMHYLNDPYHNLVMFSIFDGHGGPRITLSKNNVEDNPKVRNLKKWKKMKEIRKEKKRKSRKRSVKINIEKEKTMRIRIFKTKILFVSQYLEEHFSGAIRQRLLRGSSKCHPSLTGHSNDHAIITEVHNIDDEIVRLHPSLSSLTGSTLISVILELNRFLTVINIGDSRAVACDITGRAIPLSADHKPSDSY
uniref:PPM-type phosphatase domain-containing protein n=1 Tax=Wuchereria bancrofti TaxID=6293 RepID=A0A1I8EFY7_WUCBA